MDPNSTIVCFIISFSISPIHYNVKNVCVDMGKLHEETQSMLSQQWYNGIVKSVTQSHASQICNNIPLCTFLMC